MSDEEVFYPSSRQVLNECQQELARLTAQRDRLRQELRRSWKETNPLWSVITDKDIERHAHHIKTGDMTD